MNISDSEYYGTVSIALSQCEQAGLRGGPPTGCGVVAENAGQGRSGTRFPPITPATRSVRSLSRGARSIALLICICTSNYARTTSSKGNQPSTFTRQRNAICFLVHHDFRTACVSRHVRSQAPRRRSSSACSQRRDGPWQLRTLVCRPATHLLHQGTRCFAATGAALANNSLLPARSANTMCGTSAS